MKTLFLIAVGVLLGLPASGAEWVRNCKDADLDGTLNTSGSGFDVNNLSPGGFACADSVSNSDDAEVIDIHQCENVDVFQFADPDGEGTDTAITGTVELCPSRSAVADLDEECAPAPGTTVLSGNDAIYGLGGIWLRIEAGGSGTEIVRWAIHCAQPAGN